MRHYDVRATVALHAMYDTVHRALINRYTHRNREIVDVKKRGNMSCPQRSPKRDSSSKIIEPAVGTTVETDTNDPPERQL